MFVFINMRPASFSILSFFISGPSQFTDHNTNLQTTQMFRDRLGLYRCYEQRSAEMSAQNRNFELVTSTELRK